MGKKPVDMSFDKAFGTECQGEANVRNGKPVASIVIPTRNRIEELRELLQSIVKQSVPVEVHVMDDGADDATAEMIRLQFPSTNYHRLGTSRGPAYQRNRGIELASCNVIFPVDDDTLFVSPFTIQQTVSEFDHPRIGAVAMPYINIRRDQVVRQKSPVGKEIYVTFAFVGAAHAIRRDVFLKLDGFCEHFVIMGEEGDLCLRMLNKGYLTRVGSADPIYHLESPRRDWRRMDYYGRRNDILFAWQNVPMPYFPVHLVGTTLNGLFTALRVHRLKKMLQGLALGYVDCVRLRKWRSPVLKNIYRIYRALKKHGPLALSEVEPWLPALKVPQQRVT